MSAVTDEPVDPDASFIEKAISLAYTNRIRLSAQRVNRASQAGLPCRRRLLWSRTRTLEQKPPDERSQRYFERGNLLEDSVVRVIEEGGVKITQRQRDVEWKDLQLTGHIDGLVKMRVDANEQGPLEVKSVTRYLFDSIRKEPTLAGLLERDDHVGKYPVQVGLYCFLGGWPFGVIVFVCADTLRTLAVWIDALDPLLLARVEAHLRRLDLVNHAIRVDEDLDGEPGLHCDRCPFLGPCAPNRSWALTTSVIEDGDLIAKIARRVELHPLKLEFDHLDADLKDALPGVPGDYLAGPYVVKTKETVTTQFPMTPEEKKPFAKKVTQIRRSYEKLGPKGD